MQNTPLKPLSLEERKQISDYLKKGYSSSQISAMMGRGRNCINLDIRRSGGRELYNPYKAQEAADERHRIKIQSAKRNANYEDSEKVQQVKDLYDRGFSLMQIRDRLQINYISMQTIFKKLNIPVASYWHSLQLLENRVSAMEQQIEIILDLIQNKENND